MPIKSINDTAIVDSFSTEEVILQSKRILAHPSFRNSPTLSKFLEFIITEAIHNREQQIKEYTIAINVLNRPTDFNSHADAIVRIHAGRLRRALSEYYFTLGINDPITIYIPKGSYLPRFCRTREEGGLKSPSPPLISTGTCACPVVAIFPFRVTAPGRELDEFSFELTEQVIAEFYMRSEITLIGYYSAQMMAKIVENPLDAGKALGADFIFTGTIQQRDHSIRVHVNLLDTQSGRILTAKYYDEKFTGRTKWDIVDQLARNIMTNLSCNEKDILFSLH